MPYAKVGPQQMFYAYRSSAELCSPYLVMVHGAGGSHRHWTPVVRSLGTTSCYALDLPGHGRSGGTGHRSISDYAKSVTRFMDALQLEQAVIAGHSMGGATALMMALVCPERVAGLILVGTGARLRVLPSIMDGALHNFAETVSLICSYAYATDASVDVVCQGQRQMLQVDPQILHGDFAACDAFDVMDSVHQIRAPTLVVCGTEDRLTPAKYSSFLADRVPGAHVCWIEGAGHMVMIEKAELVAEAVRSALTSWYA